MINEEKQNKGLSKIFLWIGLIAVVICAVFTGVRLGQAFLEEDGSTSMNVASADTSGYYDYFISSDNYLVSLGWANNSNVSNFADLPYSGNTLYYKFSFMIGKTSWDFDSKVGFKLDSTTDHPTLSNYVSYDSNTGYYYSTPSYFSDYDNGYLVGKISAPTRIMIHSSQNTSRYACVYYIVDNRFANGQNVSPSYEMYSVEIGNGSYCPYLVQASTSTQSLTPISGGYYNWISYVDTTGSWRYTFFIAGFYNTSNSYTSAPQNYLDYRKYILTTSDLSDNGYYQQGYSDGYNNGLADGASEQYQTGYDAGYGVGRGVGYNEGVQASTDYTFIGLIGSTIDAPISAFRGLFNFSIFGVNMTDFLLALFSICLVIVILKFVLIK